MKNFKGLQLDYDSLPTEDTEYVLIELDVNHQLALIGLCQTLGWKTRWTSLPSDVFAYQSDVLDSLMTSLDICALVADCIENNPTVAALIEAIAKAEVEKTGASNGGGLTGTGGIVGVNTDLDKLWSGVLYVVQWLNRGIVDMLENLDAETTSWQRLAYLISATPVFETLPLDEVLGLADFYNEVTLQEYTGAYTEALELQFACDLFCQCVESGDTLTLDMMIEYFSSLMNFANPANWGGLLTQLLAGTWAGTQFAIAYFCIAVGGAKFLGVTIGQMASARQISKMFSVGALNPSSAWVIQCDDCAVWCFNWAFSSTSGQLGWVADDYGGQFAVWSGAFWRRYDDGTNSLLQIKRTWITPCQLNSVTVTGQSNVAGAAAYNGIFALTSGGGIVEIGNFAVPVGTFEITVTSPTTIENVIGIRVNAGVAMNRNAGNRITGVIGRGKGDNPVGESNC